jgi:hypothetical protein
MQKKKRMWAEKIKFWGTDQVHMTGQGYKEQVRVLTNAAASGEYERMDKADNPAEPSRPWHTPKIYKRQCWVTW